MNGEKSGTYCRWLSTRGVGHMPSSDESVACGLVVRAHEHDVLVQGHEVPMTPREFEIVSKLAEHPGWVLSAEQLADESELEEYSPESVSVHVSRLRHKLGRAGVPDAIETVRGFGYRLRAAPGASLDTPQTSGSACRALRDCAWQLTEAVLEVEHSGSDAQLAAACEAIERARRSIYASLAE